MELPTWKGAYCLCHVNPLSVRLFNHTWDAHILWIRCSCGFGYEIIGDDRYTTPLKQGDALFDKRYHSSHPLFTVIHNVVSYFCLLLYSGSHYRCQPEWSHPSTVAHSNLCTVEVCWILFGAVLSWSSCVLGLLSILTSHVQGSETQRQKIVFQGQIWNLLFSFAKHPLFICALLVPEYMLAWVIRQYMSARKTAHNNEGESDTLG